MKFKNCPDCGYGADRPNLFRESTVYSDDTVIKQPVYAQCGRCGWRTSFHDTVRGCEEEWNNTDLYGEDNGSRL